MIDPYPILHKHEEPSPKTPLPKTHTPEVPAKTPTPVVVYPKIETTINNGATGLVEERDYTSYFKDAKTEAEIIKIT